jgi:uncharacterized protein (TIGR01777 family)
MPRLRYRSQLAASADDVFAWHAREGALERLSPPWEDVRVLERSGGIRDHGRVTLRIGAGPAHLTWVAQHGDYQEGRGFSDAQVSGPFARWEHQHAMQPLGTGGCTLEDSIDYALPLGALGHAVGGALVREKLGRMFAYRHRVTADDLARHRDCQQGGPMQVTISGAHGLLGRALVPFLNTGGHATRRLVRGAAGGSDFQWDPVQGTIDRAAFAGQDGVVHLAGESIAESRWTPARKARMRDSRVDGTRLLARTLADLPHPPRVLVCASAIGFYGDRQETELTEDSPIGKGFLADVCGAWEEAARPAVEAGIRVVHLRIGVVLTPAGGALQRMLLPFRLGAGGRLGSGRQWMSWISVDDAIAALHHALVHDSLAGPVNVTAPGAVRNAEFTRVLGKVLSRPTLAAVPGFALRLALGEMADELLLASARVLPARLLASGFRFSHPTLEPALRHLLGA